MNQVSTTQETFTVDKAIIKSLIFQQAGSVERSILEVVMNELDAKASGVNIDIGDDMKSLCVYGDGVGFTSREDITKLFGRFGFNHTTDEELARNRRYGRYGLGRAQVLAFGACKWITNNFTIEVDLHSDQEGDLPYEVTEFEADQFRGTRVEVDLKEPMSLWARNNLERELKTMLKYTPQKVFLNGKQINQDPNEVKWTAKNKKIAFKISPSQSTNGLTIYNDGVFVRTYPHSQFGVSGELTSRNTTFEVNMARNDVTQSICPLWASLKEFLKPHRERKTRKSLTDNDRVFQLNAFISGEMALEEIRTKRLVKDITGKNSSLAMMMTHAGNVFTVAPSKNSTLGETVHNSRAAFVVTPDWLGNMGFDSLEELFAAIELAATTELTEITKTRHYGRDKYELDNLIREIKSRKVIEFDDITEGMDDSHVIIPDDKLTKLQKLKLKGIERMNQEIKYLLFPHENKKRSIVIGESETAQGWTDSLTYIAIERSLVDDAYSGGVKALTHIANIIIHEYCHDESSIGDHNHDGYFYQRYHDATMKDSYSPMVWAEEAFLTYFSARQKAGLGQVAREIERANRGVHQKIIAIANKS
tara:strand:- start:77454 stop:79223 length:1770 start_codon:yes stop_codon:yes gene_type:complete